MAAAPNRHHRLTICAGILSIVCLWPAATRAGALTAPKSGKAVEAFVPAGWKIESALDGDLDGDRTPDKVLVLVETKDAEPDRALVVVLKRAGGWALAGTNRGLLMCGECGGVKGGDAAPENEIAKGVLIVQQFGGSRFVYSTLHRFRWNAQRARLGKPTRARERIGKKPLRTLEDLEAAHREEIPDP